jgi:hypothetical protein
MAKEDQDKTKGRGIKEKVSGDRFGPVSVDYFMQRRVEEVRQGEGGHGDPVWTIVFDGGGLLHNYDKKLPIPKAITGAALTMQILGSLEGTRLMFGMEEVLLNPTMYSIVDPNYTQGENVFPQASDANLDVNFPDDPSPLRVADGPSADFLKAKEKHEKELAKQLEDNDDDGA